MRGILYANRGEVEDEKNWSILSKSGTIELQGVERANRIPRGTR
jgi:hypothetical protein